MYYIRREYVITILTKSTLHSLTYTVHASTMCIGKMFLNVLLFALTSSFILFRVFLQHHFYIFWVLFLSFCRFLVLWWHWWHWATMLHMKAWYVLLLTVDCFYFAIKLCFTQCNITKPPVRQIYVDDKLYISPEWFVNKCTAYIWLNHNKKMEWPLKMCYCFRCELRLSNIVANKITVKIIRISSV